jgi:N-acylneuraminate cytidylyltransferase
MKTLCVILARAGSKGLPRKNELPVAGRPMLAWTIDHALGAKRVDRVALSTDGEALAAIARERGVGVVMRPPDLADDTATVDSAARHAVTTIESQCGEAFDAVVLLYGNVPVRPTGLTDRALELLERTGCDSVQSVAPVGKMHPYWMRKLDADARLSKYEPNEVYRRQDLPPVYMLDGGIIAVRRSCLFVVESGRPHAFLGRDQRAIVTEPGEVVDVDSAMDLRVAEAVLREKQPGPSVRTGSA